SEGELPKTLLIHEIERRPTFTTTQACGSVYPKHTHLPRKNSTYFWNLGESREFFFTVLKSTHHPISITFLKA
ncbi:Hypothetical protein FKW44_015872, partial [Caligus rogercresseyi]